MDSDFLGRGWSFPVRLTSDNQPSPILFTEGVQRIEQSLFLILSTALGECPMRPEFGCGIHDLLFAELSNATIGQVISEVQSALSRWERRIEILGIQAQPSPSTPGCLLIEISYRIAATNSRLNYVYPFYLSYAP